MQIVTDKPRKGTPENVIPMINVVFLLLVFFLITARIAPPLPVPIEAPRAVGQEVVADPASLVIAPDGTVHFGEETDEAAFALLAERPDDMPLLLRADQGMDAVTLAQVLRRVGETTGAQIELVVEN